MQHGTAVGTARDDELRRLRESLYRPSPPPGAAERYRALVGEGALRESGPPAAERAAPRARSQRRGPRRARVAPVVVALAALVVAGCAGIALSRVPDPSRAETLVTGGPYAVADRDAIDALSRPEAVRYPAVLRAIRGSELPQLDVWDAREAGVWLQQGRGPLVRRFDGQRQALEVPRPFSIVVQCAGSSPYRWTIRGTTADRPEEHVLETAGAACGAPSVATFTRPTGAVVRGFDLTVPAGTRWGMAFVFPVDAD